LDKSSGTAFTDDGILMSIIIGNTLGGRSEGGENLRTVAVDAKLQQFNAKCNIIATASSSAAGSEPALCL